MNNKSDNGIKKRRLNESQKQSILKKLEQWYISNEFVFKSWTSKSSKRNKEPKLKPLPFNIHSFSKDIVYEYLYYLRKLYSIYSTEEILSILLTEYSGLFIYWKKILRGGYAHFKAKDINLFITEIRVKKARPDRIINAVCNKLRSHSDDTINSLIRDAIIDALHDDDFGTANPTKSLVLKMAPHLGRNIKYLVGPIKPRQDIEDDNEMYKVESIEERDEKIGFETLDGDIATTDDQRKQFISGAAVEYEAFGDLAPIERDMLISYYVYGYTLSDLSIAYGETIPEVQRILKRSVGRVKDSLIKLGVVKK